MKYYDVAIVGAGIVGAATALELKRRFPTKTVAVVEKELAAATHQTGRNSGVIHAGVYYEPGSLKAKFCRQGLEQTIAYCEKNKLPYEQCGKLIVATGSSEIERLETLFLRCEDNELSPQRVSKKELAQMSPNTTGQEAIYVSQTGITDYQLIANCMLDEFRALEGEVFFGFHCKALQALDYGVQLHSEDFKIQSKYLINCSGVMTDKITHSCGLELDFRIIPFKGEYFVLPSHFSQKVPHLIYPVPDPELPFLGVHLTKMIDGSVTVGPNAVLAGGKECYGKYAMNVRDCAELFSYRGFWKLLNRYKHSIWQELGTSYSKKRYLNAVQKYCPSVSISDLLPYRSGIRAQAVSLQGELIHDFKFAHNEFSLHVCNAPSPAATSAMPIANEIVNRYEKLHE